MVADVKYRRVVTLYRNWCIYLFHRKSHLLTDFVHTSFIETKIDCVVDNGLLENLFDNLYNHFSSNFSSCDPLNYPLLLYTIGIFTWNISELYGYSRIFKICIKLTLSNDPPFRNRFFISVLIFAT